MTQNLDWDLPTGTDRTISATNTDLTSDQTNLTITGYWGNVQEWGDQNDALKFYSPGLYVYTQPTEVNMCNTPDFVNCLAHGWKIYEPGDDEHYLVGNYYSFAAATANTGNSVTSGDASGSICPDKWKLPYSRAIHNNTSGSFYYLLNSYRYNFRVDGDGNTITDLVSSTGQNIASAPLYFLRGGFVDTTTLRSVGIDGIYWPRTVPSGVGAYNLHFNSAVVYPSGATPRSFGLSIRCLVM